MFTSTPPKSPIKQAEMNQSKHDATLGQTNCKLSRSIGNLLAARGRRYLHMFRPHRLAYQVNQRFTRQAKPTLKRAQTIQYRTGEIDLRELPKIAQQTSPLRQLREYIEQTIDTPILINRRPASE